MGHPLLDDFCRQKGLELRPEYYRRCQRVFRDEVTPMLEERDRLLEENAALTAQIEKLTARKGKAVEVGS